MKETKDIEKKTQNEMKKEKKTKKKKKKWCRLPPPPPSDPPYPDGLLHCCPGSQVLFWRPATES